jgi:hypothetical protein
MDLLKLYVILFLAVFITVGIGLKIAIKYGKRNVKSSHRPKCMAMVQRNRLITQLNDNKRWNRQQVFN